MLPLLTLLFTLAAIVPVVVRLETLRKRREEAEGYGIEPDPWLSGLCDQAIPPRTFSERTIIPQHPRKVADA